MVLKLELKRQILFIGLFVVLILWGRLPWISIPFFNIDEGLYAASANTILHGGVMFKSAVDPCGPVTPYFYALIFKLFGANNMFAIHGAAIFLILFTSMGLFYIGTLLGDFKAGVFAAVFFILFSSFYRPEDVWAFNTEWFAAFFNVLGVYFLFQYFLKEGRYSLLLSGLFFGLGFFSKQVSLFHFFCAGFFLIVYGVIHRRNACGMLTTVGRIIAGFILIVLFFVSFFFINHAGEDFLFWFWKYHSSFYVPAISSVERINLAFKYFRDPQSFLGVNYFLTILFVWGSGQTVFGCFRRQGPIGSGLWANLYFMVWGILSYIGASYSGRQYGHYYILILPPFCLLAARTVSVFLDRKGIKKIWSWISDNNVRMVSVFLVFISFYSYASLYGQFDLAARSKKKVFSEKGLLAGLALSQDLVAYIRSNSSEEDRIFVWGYYPEIYGLSNRISASRYINCNFLTGRIPARSEGQDVGGAAAVVPGSWKVFLEELNRNLPLYIVDTSLSDLGRYKTYVKYPLSKFKELEHIINVHYTVDKDFLGPRGDVVFRLYRRIHG